MGAQELSFLKCRTVREENGIGYFAKLCPAAKSIRGGNSTSKVPLYVLIEIKDTINWMGQNNSDGNKH